jgi:hypothetical protein
MKEAYLQFDGKALVPVSQENLDVLKSFKPNQILRCEVYGTKKARSVLQHKWAMWMIRCVADNDNDPNWNTFEQAKRQIKMIMNFFKDKPHVDLKTGVVWFELRSFAFDEMEQHEADRIYNDVKLICAERLGVDPKVLEANAQRGDDG